MMKMPVSVWTTCFPCLLATAAWAPLECVWEAIWRIDVHSTPASGLLYATLQLISIASHSEKERMTTVSSEQVISKENW